MAGENENKLATFSEKFGELQYQALAMARSKSMSCSDVWQNNLDSLLGHEKVLHLLGVITKAMDKCLPFSVLKTDLGEDVIYFPFLFFLIESSIEWNPLNIFTFQQTKNWIVLKFVQFHERNIIIDFMFLHWILWYCTFTYIYTFEKFDYLFLIFSWWNMSSPDGCFVMLYWINGVWWLFQYSFLVVFQAWVCGTSMAS